MMEAYVACRVDFLLPKVVLTAHDNSKCYINAFSALPVVLHDGLCPGLHSPVWSATRDWQASVKGCGIFFSGIHLLGSRK